MPSGKRAKALRRELGARELRRANGLDSKVWTELKLVESTATGDVFRNSQYEARRMAADASVMTPTRSDDLDAPLWITVNLLDGRPARDWRHLQAIKNALVGPERECDELFPAESRVVDVGNTTHLWVLEAGEPVRFGVTIGRHVVGPRDGVAQRPLEDTAA